MAEVVAIMTGAVPGNEVLNLIRTIRGRGLPVILISLAAKAGACASQPSGRAANTQDAR
jgi:hypothetical protein